MMPVRSTGLTPNAINQACQTGDLYKVQSAIGTGVTPDSRTFTYACLSQNIRILTAVVEAGARPDNEALNSACSTHNYAIVKKALEHGARPNDKTMGLALQSGDQEIVNLVKSTSATQPSSRKAPSPEPSSKEVEEKARRYEASQDNWAGQFNYARSNNNDANRSYAAPPANNNNTPQKSMATQLSASSQNISLFDACQSGDIKQVRSAIKNGRKPCFATLGMAIKTGNIQIVKAVLEVGALEKSGKGPNGFLRLACKTKDPEIVETVIEAGVKAENNTLFELDEACRTKDIRIVRAVIEAGGKLGGKTIEEANRTKDAEIIELITSEKKKTKNIFSGFKK